MKGGLGIYISRGALGRCMTESMSAQNYSCEIQLWHV